jgi:hypothetical protein
VVALRCTGLPGGVLRYSIVSGPSHGTLSAIDQQTGAVTYVAQPGYYGSDTFTYAATEWGSSSAPATATIGIPPAAPTCTDVNSVDSGQGIALRIVLPCHGPTGVGLVYSLVSGPSDGQIFPVDPASGRYLYLPNAGFSGVDQMSYEASDAAGSSDQATVTIEVPLTTPTAAWLFEPSGSITKVAYLALFGVPPAAHVGLFCAGRGCPFGAHEARAVRRGCRRAGCARKAGSIDLLGLFGHARLAAGTRVTLSITKPNTIGKAYVFRMHASHNPTVSVTCVPAGSDKPGGTC